MKPFNYTEAVRAVCADICARLPEFRRYDMNRVGFGFSQTRDARRVLTFASLTPLRFENGAKATARRGLYWRVPDVPAKADGLPLLYIFTVYAPRFIDLPPSEKIETLIHELYHINPEFNGDIRRFEGRNYAHGSSRKSFDDEPRRLAELWLGADPPPQVWEFLKWNFAQIRERFGEIRGARFPKISLIRVDEAEWRRLVAEANARKSE
ncbi:MAG: hypothetical protein HUK22_01205 [Thermoguttaceae bacterium]|nr:hypothetical protein [Thermoguttaceae bacterium]